MSKLNNIDDAIRDSFDNFEVPFDASQWDLLQNNLDAANGNDLTSFDKKINQTVSNHEMAYNPAAWTAVEAQLGSTVSYTKWIVAAGIVGLVSLGAYFISNSEKEIPSKTDKDSNKNIVENKSNNKVETKNNISDKKIIDLSNNKKENVKEEISNTVDPIVSNEIIVENSNTNNNSNTNPNTNNNNTQNNNSNNVEAISVEKTWNLKSPSIIGKTEICQGLELKLNSTEVSEKGNIQWMMNGVIVGSQSELVLKNLNIGTYEIDLIHLAKDEFKASCVKPILKSSTTVVVNENATVDFKYDQIGDAFYPETKFQIMSPEKNVKYTWVVNNQVFSGEELIHLFNNKGNYPVSLTAQNENGCITEEIKNIDINTDYNLLAPIAFTPNYDGLNDVFIPEALKVLNLPFKMVIYDRQQGIVYQTTRSDAPWDGRNMNTGDAGGQGAYLWVVELTNKKGEIEPYSGTITILK